MPEDQREIVKRIQETIQGSEKIPASQVRTWLRHSSLNVVSVAMGLIDGHTRRVEPPLSMEEICNAVRDYYRRCLLEEVGSGFVPPKHIAGYELVNWFRILWNDSSVPREYLLSLKTMIRDLYFENEQIRDTIVNGVVEHLFETPEIAEYFSDWKADPVLKRAYDLAMEWGRDHWPKP